MPYIVVGATGLPITVRIRDYDTKQIRDISSATTKEIILTAPDGHILTKTADFVTDGSDGKLVYTTIAGDLDAVGEWRIHAHVVMSSIDIYSRTKTFNVYGRG